MQKVQNLSQPRMIVIQARTPAAALGAEVGVGLVAIEPHVDERIAARAAPGRRR